jgi:hypothetical protein
MKKGDTVIFTGATEEQIQWGGNDDPNQFLKVGDKAVIEAKEVHSWHTKLYLVGIPGKFNSVSFVKANDEANACNTVISNGIAMEDHPGLKE